MGGEDGTTLANDGTKSKDKCTQCGRTSHKTADCYANRHTDGTVLHTMGDIEEIKEFRESNDDGSSELSSDFNTFCNIELEELMFIQPHIHSPEEKQSVCSKNLILKTWILLDSQSTVDVISNGDLLTKIHQVKTTLRIRCNAGMKTTNFRGHLSGYGWVWFYPDGIANILSLSRVKDKYRVTFDSATDNCFRVHKDNGKILKF